MLIILFAVSLFLLSVFLKINNSSILSPGPYYKFALYGSVLTIFAPLIIYFEPEILDLWQFRGVSYSNAIKYSYVFYFQYICFFIGLILSTYCLRSKYHYLISDNIAYKKNERLVVVLFSFSIIINCLTISKAGVIPILGYFTGGFVPTMRIQAGNNINGLFSILYSINTFISWALIFISASMIINKVRYAYLLLLLPIFSLTWLGSKSGLLLILIALFFFFIEKKKVSLTFVFKLASLLATLVFILYLFFVYSGVSEGRIFLSIINRLFMGQMHGFYQEFTVFNNVEGNYWKSWIPVSSLFYDTVPSYARDVMVYTEGITDRNGLKDAFLGAELSHEVGIYLSYPILLLTGLVLGISFCVFSLLVKYTLGSSYVKPFYWAYLTSVIFYSSYEKFPSFKFFYIPMFSVILIYLISFIIPRKGR